MESNKDNVKKIFDSFDKDGDGSIEPEEIMKMSQELGNPISEAECKRIYKHIDIDHDGKISFEEFYNWWNVGKQNKLQELVFLKAKSMKLFLKLENKLNKMGNILQNKSEHQHHAEINVGEILPTDKTTTILFKALVGEESKQYSQEVLAGFQLEQTAAIVIKIKCVDVVLAKEKFTEIFEQAKQFAQAFMDKEEQLALIEKVSFKYAIPAPDFLSIAIYMDHSLITDIVDQYSQMAEQFLGKDIGLNAKVQLTSNATGASLAANPQGNYTSFLTSGATLAIDVKIPEGLQESIKSVICEQAEKYIEQGMKYKTKYCRNYAPLLLLKKSSIKLSFNKMEDAIDILPVQQMVDSISPGKVMEEIPILLDFYNTCKNYCASEFSFNIVVPKAVFTLFFSSEGLSQCIDKLMGN